MLAVLLVVVAQAAPPKGLGLRELQERARKNDPRTMQVAAQLEAARGKRDEASWVFFPAFQTTAYLAGPTPPSRRSAPASRTRSRPRRSCSRRRASRSAGPTR